jgi:hypothetical protein
MKSFITAVSVAVVAALCIFAVQSGEYLRL